VTNFLSYFQSTGQLLAKLKVNSKKLIVEDFENKILVQKNTVEKSRAPIFPEKIALEMQCDVGQISWNEHVFFALSTKLHFAEKGLSSKQFTLRHADSEITGNFSLFEKEDARFDGNLKLGTNHFSIQKWMKEWNDFDQNYITHQTLSGTGKIGIESQFYFDAMKDFDPQNLKAKIHFILQQGRMKEVPFMQELTKELKNSKARFLFSKKQFQEMEHKLNDIQFSTLENTFLIDRGNIEIPFMHLSSNALNLDFYGKQSFQGAIDYHVAFKLRDLIVSDEMTEFGIVEADKSGIKLYARIHGTTEKPQFTWDFEQAKQDNKQKRQEAKQEAISILKSEFSRNKSDSTYRPYAAKPTQKEEIFIDFSNKREEETIIDSKKESEIGKRLKQKLNNMKKEQNPKVEFEIEK
jgi:hypothetical protein